MQVGQVSNLTVFVRSGFQPVGNLTYQPTHRFADGL